MKALDSFTVERLEELGAGAMFFTGDEVAALARIALAAKRAEPVSLESAIEKFKEYNIGFPVEKLKADFVISWCLTNLTPQLNSPEMRKLILSEVSDFCAGLGNPGEPELPEDIQQALMSRIELVFNNCG
ncbi:TPA: hypothetical protein RY571_000592 [Yersinia enterocolitica]|nr:hypothetical protein [Yersinia enterocolitica]